MKIHEYQAKDILAKYGVPVPAARWPTRSKKPTQWRASLFARAPAASWSRRRFTPVAAAKAAASRSPRTCDEAESTPRRSSACSSSRTRPVPQGQKVQRLLIEETPPIERELYLGIVLDRANGKLVFMASQAGGMEIEEVAAKDPEAIYKEYIDPAVGLAALPGAQARIRARSEAHADQRKP